MHYLWKCSVNVECWMSLLSFAKETELLKPNKAKKNKLSQE